KQITTTGRRALRKRSAKVATTDRLSLIIGVGTTGALFERLVRKREPRFREATMAIDPEISPADAAQADHLVAPPDRGIDEYRARALKVPLIRQDSLIPTLDMPHESERGAGACRPLGSLKAAVVLDTVRQKLNRKMRRLLL